LRKKRSSIAPRAHDPLVAIAMTPPILEPVIAYVANHKPGVTWADAWNVADALVSSSYPQMAKAVVSSGGR
jgi:hypothetical protein